MILIHRSKGIKAPRKGKSSKDNIMEITSNNNGNPITDMGHKYVGVEGKVVAGHVPLIRKRVPPWNPTNR